MNVAEPFIRRPVMTTLLMSAILLFGVAAYRELPVSDLPNVDFPTLLVSATLPGTDPETMASAVATPLERAFSTIAGIDAMSSVNGLGTTQITVQFTLERDIDSAAQDVQAAISGALGLLPRDLPSPPTWRKVNPADQPILFLSLRSATLPLSLVDKYAETVLAQRISTISGVAQVQVFGAQKYAVRVRLDPRALAAREIGIDEVMAAVQQGNVNLPSGVLDGTHRSWTLEATGQLVNADAFRPLVIAYRGGAPVRLGDVGSVVDSVENDRVASWYGADRAIVLAIQRQPGTNTVAGRRRDPGAPAADPRPDPRRRAARRAVRPLAVDPRLGGRREVHAGADHGSRDPRDLPVPPERVRDADSGRRAAALGDRHLRRHVAARLQPRQPLADGAHAVGRLRGRRRDRDAREHRAAHGEGKASAAAQRSTARRRSPSRSSR